MHKYKLFFALLFTLLTAAVAPAKAQCGIENKAFQSGEHLVYDLYFNWKFVWVKVGSATMSTVSSIHNGQPIWRSSLITRGNDRLDGMFIMRDTLLSYCSKKDLSPLYYRKGAREGKRYYVDELWYSYPKGNCQLKRHHISSRGNSTWSEVAYKECIYDMMSIFLRSRNYDASKLNKGDIIPMPISDARHLSNSWLKYRGKENFKMEGSKNKFRCLVFSFMEREDDKDHELIRFYVTDDDNHIPMRLDMFLSFGSAKAFIRGYKGIRGPMTSTL